MVTARKRSLVFGIVAMMAFMTSCGAFAHKFEPTQNGIYVKRDGKLQSALFMELEGTSYHSEGLKEFVQAEVNRYNEEKGEEKVQLLEAELKDGRGKVVYEYADPAVLMEYAKFTQDDSVKFTEIKLLNADTAADSGIVDEEVLSQLKGKAQLIVIDGAARITTEGKILTAKSDKGKIVHDDYDIVTGVGESYIVFR